MAHITTAISLLKITVLNPNLLIVNR